MSHQQAKRNICPKQCRKLLKRDSAAHNFGHCSKQMFLFARYWEKFKSSPVQIIPKYERLMSVCKFILLKKSGKER